MQFLYQKILYKCKGTNGNYFVMTQITPNAYDRLYDLGITGEDLNKLFTGKQSPYIASKLGIPQDTQPDSFEKKPKVFTKENAKKVGFIALVGVLTFAGIKKGKNVMNQFRKTGFYKGLMKFFKRTPKPPKP